MARQSAEGYTYFWQQKNKSSCPPFKESDYPYCTTREGLVNLVIPDLLADFSEELGISPSTLQDYLKANGNPTIKMIEHLAEKMGVDPAALVTGQMDAEQHQIIPLLLDTIQAVAGLPYPKRLKFAELFLELVQLWEGYD